MALSVVSSAFEKDIYILSKLHVVVKINIKYIIIIHQPPEAQKRHLIF